METSKLGFRDYSILGSKQKSFKKFQMIFLVFMKIMEWIVGIYDNIRHIYRCIHARLIDIEIWQASLS